MNFPTTYARRSLLLRLKPLIALVLFLGPPVQADGPGLPNLAYTRDELFRTLAVFDASNGSPRGQGTVAMHKGYLAVIFSGDGGQGDGGFSFYDISNPRSPRLVNMRRDSQTYDILEAHGFGFSSSYPGDYVVVQATGGVQFWDWSNVTNPFLINYLRLPGVTASDYFTSAWWAFWQAPYVYVGGSNNGLYIIDATDPRAPVLVNRGGGRPNPIPPGQIGGFKLGPVFAVGNLLVATNMEGAGYATFDISDPVNPTLIRAQSADLPSVYSVLVNGHKILGAGTDNRFYAHDITDPARFRFVNSSASMGDRGGYLSFQDGFAHVGASVQYAKIDMRSESSYPIVGTGSSAIPFRDEDFATVLGNLVFVGSDHDVGSVIMPHQTEPDTRGPEVNMVSPQNGAINQALTTRIGLTFTDQIDLRSVDTNSFVIRPLGGAPLPGKYSSQTGIVNFSPDRPLAPNTIYEVVVPAGGVKDYAGNPTAAPFTSLFSTGSTVSTVSCEIESSPPVRVGKTVVFSVRRATGQGTLLHSWDFGDGSSPTPFSISPAASHSYQQPGHYAVVLTVTDDYGRASASLVQTVYVPPTTTQPTSSGTIIIDRQRNRVWAVNADSDTVTAIDAINMAVLFEKPVGRNPRTLAQGPDGRIWVVNQADATISILHPVTGDLMQTINLPYGSMPYGVTASPDGSAMYVTLQGSGRLLKLNPLTLTLDASVEVGPDPRGVAASGDSNRILVTRFISPQGVGEILEINSSGFSVERTFSLAFDPGPDTEANGRGVPNYISSLTISPDGRRAWVPSKKDNTARGLYRDRNPLTFESTVRTIVSQIDLVNNREDLGARRDLNDRDMASAIRFTDLGDYAFVATQGTNTVEILDAYSGRSVAAIENVGLAPQGLVLDGASNRLFVQNFMSRSVSVYDVTGIVTAQVSPPQQLRVISTVSHETLSAQVLLGKRIFYNAGDPRMNRDRYISCASCHLDGGQDGRVWDFTDRGEGFRNTIALHGRRGMGHGRVHWTANFDEIQDFENDIRSSFGGAGFMTDEQFQTGTRRDPLGDPKAGISLELDALAAYVSSLTGVGPSPYRNPDGSLTDDARAGKEQFRSLNCASCHSGIDFTDSGGGLLHDVGTIRPSSGRRIGMPLTGLDTPTLKGIWGTAPYLHDGSAATLLDVLTTANPEGRHGEVTRLSEEQKRQLVAYLLQIDESEIDAAPPSQRHPGSLTTAVLRHNERPIASLWQAGQ